MTCKKRTDLPSSEFLSLSSSSEVVPANSPTFAFAAASSMISLLNFPSASNPFTASVDRVASPFSLSPSNFPPSSSSSLSPSGNGMVSSAFLPPAPSVKSEPPSVEDIATAASLATSMLLVRGTASNTGTGAVLADPSTIYVGEVRLAMQVHVPERVPESAVVGVQSKDTDVDDSLGGEEELDSVVLGTALVGAISCVLSNKEAASTDEGSTKVRGEKGLVSETRSCPFFGLGDSVLLIIIGLTFELINSEEVCTEMERLHGLGTWTLTGTASSN